MSDPTILAAGPPFGGELTRPYRFVVLRWPGGGYSAHTQFLDPEGGFSDGEYCRTLNRAVSHWLARIAQEYERRPGCLLPAPEGEA
jgi:hypothetical protein